MSLNTYKEIEHLKSSGASQELAAAIVELYRKSNEHLATKNDIVMLEPKIENLGVKLESKIDNIEIKLISKIDVIATILESSIRELKSDNSWIKVISIANFSAIACALIAYLIK